jgi:5-methylthioadenosine/S-adenosylhomocysteine deaminase
MRRFDLGVRAGYLLPMRGGQVAVEEDRFLGIRGGEIVEVVPWKARLKTECRKFIDGREMACLPGLVNGHTHLPMTLFRGLEDDVSFHTWLFERILPLEARMVSRQFVRAGTELAALECIRFGVTTVNEMYFYAGETAAVLEKAGLRGIVSQTMADFPLPEDKDLGTDKFALVDGLRKKFRNSSRIEIGLGPHAPYSCGDELLRKVGRTARELGAPVHIHLSETGKEVEDSRNKFGMSPVERLEKLGLLGERVLCAHCVHLDEGDREIFRRSGASVIYNPDSNAKLGSGVAPIADYLKRGIPVSLGTDGAASNNDLSLFGAMDLGTKLQKLQQGDTAAFTAAQALSLATYGGAKALGLAHRIGSLEPGKRADFLLVGLDHPHLRPRNDLVSHLVYSAQGLEVDTVACDGRILLEKGKFRTLKPAAVFARAETWRRKIAKALQELR